MVQGPCAAGSGGNPGGVGGAYGGTYILYKGWATLGEVYIGRGAHGGTLVGSGNAG